MINTSQHGSVQVRTTGRKRNQFWCLDHNYSSGMAKEEERVPEAPRPVVAALPNASISLLSSGLFSYYFFAYLITRE